MSVQDILVHASTPATKSGSGATATSNAFSPPAGSRVLVALRNGSDGTLATGLSDNLTALTWERIADDQIPANDTTFEFWSAVVDTAPGSMTVSATWSGSKQWAINPIVLTGSASSQAGAAIEPGSNTGKFSQALETTADGSLVVTIAAENSSTAPTPATGQTITIGGSTSFTTTDSWVQLLTAPAGSAGTTVTMAATNPTPASPGWAALSIEILAEPDTGAINIAHGGAWVACDAAKKAHAGAWV